MENPQEPDPAKREELPANLARPDSPPPSAPESPGAGWIRRLLACNPFYLVSAALLLLGFYLVSGDANFPGREVAQFNFTALQGYEILLVATAILACSLWFGPSGFVQGVGPPHGVAIPIWQRHCAPARVPAQAAPTKPPL